MKTTPDTEQKRYERLDRHVRTSATVRELMHWDCMRLETRLDQKHDQALRKEIETRFLHLTGGKTTCSAK
jgi:hypothetical protein